VWVCVCVGFIMFGCFVNMCTCTYRVLYCLVYIYLFLFVLSVLLPPSDISIAFSNKNNNSTPRFLYTRKVNPVSIVQKDEWAQQSVWMGAENLPLQVFDSQTVQLAAESNTY
jgi:hypothetical protein